MMKSMNVLMTAFAILGLSLTATGASAQAFYVDPYPAVVAPERGYVVRQTLVAPPPLVRERTVVVSRPTYVPVAPVLPFPRYGYAEERYVVTDW
jgi:hypothetical protein